MSSAYENTVFDFDLDFLNQPLSNNAEPDLQAKANRLRKSIIFLKQRITCIDKLTVASKNAKKEKEDLMNSHVQLKQQCGQHLMEISYFIGKVTSLENEIQAVETREREKIETICELENKILALETVNNQLKILDEEKNKTESTTIELKKGRAGVASNAKKRLVAKEVETLHQDNILKLEKENEKLHKENAKISDLEKEIENLRKKNVLASKSYSISNNEIARIQKLEKEIGNLYNEKAKIPNLEKEIENLQRENFKIPKFVEEIENLQKENTKIPKLMKEIENLQKENSKIPKLVKEIENLQKENSKIPKLVKEIETLRKENAKITKLRNDDETISKLNVRISNLEKAIETLRIKNAKLEIDKALCKEVVEIPSRGEDIETRQTGVTATTKEKDQLRPKINNLTRKYKSLPDGKSEWTDNNEVENNVFEDPLLSPTQSDTVIAKKYPIADKDIAGSRESDNDNSNEVASVDTGRGSSLANSDTDKGLHSPEYFLNYSPPNGENIENKEKTEDVAMTRRPILIEEIEPPAITIVKHNNDQNVGVAKSASHRRSHSQLTSPVNQTNAARDVSDSVEISDVSPKKRFHGVQEKECLEMNNRLQRESHTDLELENIFSTMKLDYNAVTPIPKTPILVHEVDSTSSSSVLNEKFKKCSVLFHETADFMRILMGLVLSQDRNDNSFIINECDKLITSFESLKSQQIQSEPSIHITNSNMEVSDCVLSHDDNNLRSISNPESASSPGKETEIFQNKKSENRLSNESLSMLQDGNLLLHDDSVVSISNLSSSDKDTTTLRNKWVEKTQLLNHSFSEELVMDSEISKVTERCSQDIEDINQSPIKKSFGTKSKNKKITKLDKLRKQLKPKNKIVTEPKKLRIKPKQLLPNKMVVSVNDTSASLNDKDAYEKAVKFMAEMKSQQGAKAKSPKHIKVLMSPTHTVCLGKDINKSSHNQALQNCPVTTLSKRNFSELFDSCEVVLIKDPPLLSPRKTENLTTHEAKEDNNSTTHRANNNNSTTHRANNANNSTTHRAEEDNNTTTQIVKVYSNSKTHRAKEDNNSKTHRAEEDNNSTTHRAKEDNNSTSHRAEEDNNTTTQIVKVYSNSKTHRAKEDNNSTTHRAEEDKNTTTKIVKVYYNSKTHRAKVDTNSTTHKAKEDNNSTTHKAKEDNNSTSHRAEEDKNTTTQIVKVDANTTTHIAKEDNNTITHRAKDNNNITTHIANEDNNITTHVATEDNNITHKAKEDNNMTTHIVNEDVNTATQIAKEDTNTTTHRAKEGNNSMSHNREENNESSDELPSRKRRRRSSNEPLIQYKRVLRSSTINTKLSTEDTIELSKSNGESNRKSIKGPGTNDNATQFNNENTLKCLQLDRHENNVVSYGDLDLFSEELDKNISAPVIAEEDNNDTTHIAKEDDNSMPHKGSGDSKSFDEPLRKRCRRSSIEPLQYKRVLRSAPIQKLGAEDNTELSKSKGESNTKSIMGPSTNVCDTQFNKENTLKCLQPVKEVNTDATACRPGESILCYMIEKDARDAVRPYEKQIPDSKVNRICENIEQHISAIIETNDRINAMDNFVADLRKLNYKHFIEGLMKYLAKPERKFELLGKLTCSKFAAMTKAEQILLYAITQLETHWPSIVDAVLGSIEFTLFKLNRTPEFDVVETTSHFYALLCKNYKAINRLRLFMLDAMYCIQFKSVPLIKQCLDVWKELIPLPHKRIAQNPMVTCLVYLLHFYKCDDKLNRVQEVRNILHFQYHYQITNWNESKILAMFRNCIMELRDISIEKKILRLTLIILAKRNGPKWCQNHIVKNLLQPMIEKENVPNYVKEFCVSMIGPLMKPYPADMKVHCEIAIIQLVDILNKNPSPDMEEAAITSMMYINRHDQLSINKTLLSRKMKPMSLALEKSICNYVKAKPLRVWKAILLRREYACNFS